MSRSPSDRFDEEAFTRGVDVLRAYVAREGHARVPRGHVEAGFPLGGWVEVRRRDRRRGRVSAQRAAVLEVLPGWSWGHEDTFVQRLAVLRQYAEREGHIRVPRSYGKESGDEWLRGWVSAQRQRWRAGRLPAEQAAALEAVPGWSWEAGPATDTFEAGLRALRAFADREGHVRIPRTWVESGVRLGDWVGTRRREYRAGRLSEARVTALEDVPGWSWAPYAARRRRITEG